LLRQSRLDDRDRIALGVSFREGLAFWVAYLAVGVLSYSFVFEKWSIVDSLYFSCSCFSTVGYGDLCPATAASKLFTCIFALGGIACLGTAIATIGSVVVQAEVDAIQTAQRQSRERAVKQFFEESIPNPLSKKKDSSKTKKDTPFTNNEYLLSIGKSADRATIPVKNWRTAKTPTNSEYLAAIDKKRKRAPVEKGQGATAPTYNSYLSALETSKLEPSTQKVRRSSRFRRLSRHCEQLLSKVFVRTKKSHPSSNSQYLMSINKPDGRNAVLWELQASVFRYLPALCIVVSGGAIMRYLNREVVPWSWVDALYYAFVTGS